MSTFKQKFTFIFGILTLLFLCTGDATAKNSQEESVEDVKAVFIWKFANLVEFPEHANVSDKNKAFVIGIMGETPVESSLNEMARSKKIVGKRIRVIRIVEYPQIESCNILFISEFSRKKLKDIMEVVDKLPILTIGDTEDYEKRGVMINLFLTPQNKLRFNVNRRAAKRSGISLTSKIVGMASNIIK
jgi:hypothetical protein